MDEKPFSKAVDSALSKGLESQIGRISEMVTRHGYRLIATPADVTKAVKRHLESLEIWSQAVSFKDLAKPKLLLDTYVDLDLQLNARAHALAKSGEPRYDSVASLINFDKHCVLLGDVGAGKTTSVKRLIQLHLKRCSRRPDKAPIPILFQLRDLKAGHGLPERVLLSLGIDFKETGRQLKKRPPRNIVAMDALLQLACICNATLFLDGLDEIRPGLTESVVDDIRTLLLRLDRSRVVLTCRSAAFDYSFEHAQIFELRPLTTDQNVAFVERWLADQPAAHAFRVQLQHSPYGDTAVRPLTLAHLCAVFQRYGKIPDKPKIVYRKIVRLLLEEWDLQRSVKRQSAYADFDSDRKQEFLERLAFALRGVAFDHSELEQAYVSICDDFGLGRRQVRAVTREIESHNGLVVQTSYDTYSFAHKSLHEYLAAEYLVKLPSVYGPFSDMPNEYAIAVALSASPSEYFAALIFGPGRDSKQNGNIVEFLARVMLERPDFGVDEVLGLSLMFLDHMLERSSLTQVSHHQDTFLATTGSKRRLREIINELLQMEPIAKSLEAACRYCECRSVGSQLIVLNVRAVPAKAVRMGVPATLEISRQLLGDRLAHVSGQC